MSATEGAVTTKQAHAIATGLMTKGHFEPAAEIYRRILALVPDDVDAFHYLGVAVYHLGSTREAVELIRRAIALDPSYVDAHNNLGNVLRQQGLLNEAQSAYERVLELRPENAEALNNLGTIVRAKGRPAEAVAVYRRALELAPDYSEAYHNLGNALFAMDRDDEAFDAFRRAMFLKPYELGSYRSLGTAYYSTGRVADAAEVYRKWLTLAPNDAEALHLLSACTGEGVPERCSDEFVRKTFDRFAFSFDEVLARLEYRAPAIVAEAIRETLGAPRSELQVLDAGCGTGLAGPLLRPFAKRLVGIDLSEKMLGLARERALYDELEAAELTEYLERRRASYDLVTSIDTLVYFGDLSRVARGLTNALGSGGRAVFTVEKAEASAAPGGYKLNPHGRYGHVEGYVRGSLEAAGLEVVLLREVELRMERRQPVAGYVVMAVSRTSR